MVTFSALTGFVLAGGSLFSLRGLCLLLGSQLLAMGANGLNQWWEADRDARMLRTRARPLTTGQLARQTALTACLLWSATGLGLLGSLHLMAAALGLFTWYSYLFVYTPMKTRTSLAVLAGALTGALPPMMGWVALNGQLGLPAWVLGCLLYLWQIPHFLSLACLYEQDYRRGGFKLLPDRPDRSLATRSIILVFSIALLVISLLAPVLGLGGKLYLTTALACGSLMVWRACQLFNCFSRNRARQLFLVSLLYLSLVLLALWADVLWQG
ncbi:hypothetical protein GCM10027098_27350 [Bowmanella dokdonensis]